MYDVNPLGPMMRLKQIEREALALRASAAKDSSGTLNGWACVRAALKRLLTSPRPEVRGIDRFNLGRQ